MTAAEDILKALLEETRAMRHELAALRRDQVRESLSVQEAALRLRVDRTRLGKLVQRGLVRGVKEGARYRIPVEEVRRLAAQGLPELPRPGRPRKRRDESAEILAIDLGRKG